MHCFSGLAWSINVYCFIYRFTENFIYDLRYNGISVKKEMQAKRKMTEEEFKEFVKQYEKNVKILTSIEKAKNIFVEIKKYPLTKENWEIYISPERADRRRGYIAHKIEEAIEQQNKLRERDNDNEIKAEILVY